MKQFRCDGKGVAVGKRVAVRERTLLKDKGFYIGTVIYVGGNSSKDVVFIRKDNSDCVMSTYRHCVFACRDNWNALYYDVSKEIAKVKNKIKYLNAKIRTDVRDIRSILKENDYISEETGYCLEDISAALEYRQELCTELAEYLEELKSFRTSIYNISQESNEKECGNSFNCIEDMYKDICSMYYEMKELLKNN